jgi:hypothetical protein
MPLAAVRTFTEVVNNATRSSQLYSARTALFGVLAAAGVALRGSARAPDSGDPRVACGASRGAPHRVKRGRVYLTLLRTHRRNGRQKR